MSEPNVVLAAFRLPTSLIKRVDRHAKRLSDRTGFNVSRADAVRSLLNAALVVEEQQQRGKKL